MRTIYHLLIRSLAKWLSIASILPVIGCAVSNPYPTAWPQVKQLGGIESQIEGSYNCYGNIVTCGTAGDQPKGSAADFLIASNRSTGCSYITILKPRPDEIEISIFGSGVPVHRLAYMRGEGYRIEGNWIVLRSTGFFSASAYGVGHTSVETSISLSSEDDLIMKGKNTSIGALLFVIPLGVSGTDWGRFDRTQ